jgi:ribosome-binding factor A
MAAKRRVFRVAEQIRNLVAMELQRVADPRLEMVTITSVVVSPDLRYAKIYWMVADQSRVEDVQDGFLSAAGHFRRLLARELGARFVPEIKFFYDDTYDTRDEVDRLLAKAGIVSHSADPLSTAAEEEDS